MKTVFLQILDMSVAASILAAVVIVLRLLLKKAPKAIHCALWAMVALRLICPSLPESQASLMPDSHPVSSVVQAEEEKTPAVQVQPPVQMPSVQIPQTPAPQAPVTQTPAPENNATITAEPENTVHWAEILSIIWLSGVVVMALYGFGSYLYLRRKVAPAVKEDGIWLCDNVASPFILGIFRPRIYLPSALEPEHRTSVLAHERSHLRRKDHWWKPLGFALLAVHWFNPVMWLSYILLCRDIEAACDQRVVKGMEPQERKAYSEALLSCAAPRRSIAACPLAFGEQGVKGRIKSVLSYKKPTIWIILAALIVSAVVGVLFLTNPLRNGDQEIEYAMPANSKKVIASTKAELEEKAAAYFMLNDDNGFELFVWEEQDKIWCGILESGDRPKTQEEVDELLAVSLPDMKTILWKYSVTKINLHLIGRFTTLEASGGESLSTDVIELWMKHQLSIVRLTMKDSETFFVEDPSGEDYTYHSTKSVVDVEKVGLLLAEGITTLNCILNPDIREPICDVYAFMNQDLTYLALYSKDYKSYKLFMRSEKEHVSDTNSYNLVMNMEIAQSVPFGLAFDAVSFYAYDRNGHLYRVYCNDMTGLYEGQTIRVTYDSSSKVTFDTPMFSGGWSPKYEITATKVEYQPKNEYVTTVYFLYDPITMGWMPESLPGVAYYAAPVTAEERDILLKLHEGRAWHDTMLSSYLPQTQMVLNVVEDGTWNYIALRDEGYIVKERYYAVLTQEEQEVIKNIKNRAAISLEAENYFTDDYLVYQQKTKQ